MKENALRENGLYNGNGEYTTNNLNFSEISINIYIIFFLRILVI